MKAVFLCHFDERKGYVPIEPVLIDNEEYNDKDLLKEVARNAIGFGSQLEFNSFSLSGVNCISQRFYVPIEGARGGIETYALVIMSNDEVMNFKPALNKTVEYLKDWQNINDKLASLYESIKHPEQALSFAEEDTETFETRPISVYSHKSFRPRRSHFSESGSTGRNFLMGVGCSIILLTILMSFLYSQPFENFNFWKYAYTNILMFFVGLLTYTAVNKKKYISIIEVTIIFLLFIIPLYLIVYSDIILDTVHYWAFFTSYLAALLISIGIDNEGKIDRISTLILIFFILLIFLFIMVYIITA